MKLQQLLEARYAGDWRRSEAYQHIIDNGITHETSEAGTDVFFGYLNYDDAAEIYDEVRGLVIRNRIDNLHISVDEVPIDEDEDDYVSSVVLNVNDNNLFNHPVVRDLIFKYGTDEDWDI
jgi:hypothetical protein